jgi:VWFA-related protein
MTNVLEPEPAGERQVVSILGGRLIMKRAALVLSISLLVSFPQMKRGTSPASAQEPGGRLTLQHRTTVSLKLIQVVVTDRRGNPITDLEERDFIVLDNGEEKKITEFEKHALSVPASEAPAAKPGEVVQPPRPAAVLLGRKFFLLFDSVFVDVNGYRIARDAVLRFIESDLTPEDEVAVLTFTGRGSLRVHVSPTKDHAAALASVRSLIPGNLMSLVAPPDPGDDDDFGMTITGSSDSRGGSRAMAASPVASDARLVAGNFIWSLRTLAQALRYMPGKKHLILCSNGIRGKNIGRGEYAYGRNTDLSRDYSDMCKELAASNISVYPINTADTTIGLKDISRTDSKESKTGIPFLREMASSTGGRFLGAARNARELMERVHTMTAAYYVIGYPISETWDGMYHTVRVKVRRPGADVDAQPGYFNPKPFSDYSELEKKIDLVDLALAEHPLSQEPVRFPVRALPEAGDPPDNLHMLAEVSSTGLGDVAGERIEFVSLLFDPLDRIVDLRRTELDLTPGTLGTNRAFLYSALSAPPGNYRCRIVLRNLESGRAAVAGSDITWPRHETGKVLIFAPLFFISGGETRYLGATAGKDAHGNPLSVPDQVAGAFLFDPKRFSPCPEGPIKSPSSLFASLQGAAASGDASRLKLSATLTDESAGTETPIPLAIIAEREGNGTKTFFVRLDIPELEWGAYVLSLIMNDDLRGLSSRVMTIMSIE